MRLSASQITTYLDCMRKWSFIYQDNVEVTPNRSAALGTDVHAQLETHLLGGEIDYTKESGYIAAAALPYLPPPSKALEVEHEFLLVSPRHSYAGVIDCRYRTTVIDHKTTSDLRWAKSSEDLLYDVQAALYATTTLVKTGAPSVTLQWSYVTNKKPYKAQPVVVEMSREHAEEMFTRIEDIADEIESVRGTPTLSLPPSPETCERYGGCPFRCRCNLSPIERMKSIVSNTTENLIQSLRARRAINPPPVEEATKVEVPPPAPVPEVETAEVDTALKIDTTPAPAPSVAKSEKKPIDTLYLGCFPVGSKKCESFDVMVAKVRETIEQEQGVADYRYLPFGQGPGALAKGIETLLKSSKISEMAVFNASTPEALVCLSVLMANATRIVQAVR